MYKCFYNDSNLDAKNIRKIKVEFLFSNYFVTNRETKT